MATGVLGRTHEQALATPISRIEQPAYARVLLQADPAQILNAAVVLGKHVKPKLKGRALAMAQIAAFDNFAAALESQRRPKSKKRRR